MLWGTNINTSEL
jgi:DNA replication licensing factor MCM4